ncbi:MAG: class I SAM-dependent methyltransferase, partial [Leptospira sp.]|nr:class I SAM-dependent methyltransferase [Leptospira sp.]
SFALFYECAVPGMVDQKHSHSHNHGDTHNHGEANQYMHQTDVTDLAKRFDEPARDKWQKPDVVLDRIHQLLTNSKAGTASQNRVSQNSPVLWEIGAGSGYFSTKFVGRGWTIIAADPNPEFLNILQEKKKTLAKKEQSRFIIQKIPYDAPAINRKDVDLVFSSNTYHHIENRSDYFSEVKKALGDRGSLMIVDFEKGKSGMGPPQNMRFTPKEVIDELKQAGFKTFEVDSKSFPYQFMLIAR